MTGPTQAARKCRDRRRGALFRCVGEMMPSKPKQAEPEALDGAQASNTEVNSWRVGRRARTCTLSCGVEAAELLGVEQILGSVSLPLHFGELALQPIALLDDIAHRTKEHGRRQEVHAAERTRDLGTHLGADYQFATAHLLPFGRERPSTLGRHTTALHDVAQARAWSSSSNASAAASPSGGALGARAVRARWISSGSKK